MRVTKTIREYIESQVQKKYEERIAELSKEYDKEVKAIDKKCKELIKGANESLRSFVSENYPNWIETVEEAYIRQYSSFINRKMSMDIREKRNLLNQEVKNHITEIILTLELGGSKKELEDMLNKIN